MKKVLLTIATAAALLAPATATPATSAGHGYRANNAPRLMQRGLESLPQFRRVRCEWFVPSRSISCTARASSGHLTLTFKPFRKGWQYVTSENLATGAARYGRERCPAALRCY